MNINAIISDEVEAAVSDKKAVVALESTILAHGLPSPENFEVGMALEKTVREAGAVPATIAVIDGKIRVGLTSAEMERVCAGKTHFAKVGAADLGPMVALGGSGATTVSATTLCAHHAGIRVFATGGIGGVHRGDAMDISSDLTILSRYPVTVVSAGCKAILDLPRTLEHLETLAVLVVGYQTAELPAFYTRQSGLPLEHTAASVATLASMLQQHFSLTSRGAVVANPIPAEAALDATAINHAIESALATATKKQIKGKAVTPFLLAELARVTGHKSLAANRALAINNARLGAELARELTRIA